MIRGESWTKPEDIKAALSPAGQAGGGPVLYCENNRCWVHKAAKATTATTKRIIPM